MPLFEPVLLLLLFIKVKIYQLYPWLEYAPDNQGTLQALIQAAKEAWEAIDSAVLQNLCATMPHRVQANTKY
jgi:hypothetical protein